jgi:endonuclease/exonuclease/phosphatase (EEP) superfamily protein YafD
MVPTPARPFVVMTHNVGNGLAPPAGLCAMLRAAGADLIGLQEVTAAQAAALEHDLADLYPYRVLYGEGIPGKGLLSKFPLHAVERLQLYPRRPDLRATVELEGGSVLCIVAHPRPPGFHWNGFYMNAQSRTQIAALIALATAGPPAILLGDFNLTELTRLYNQIRCAGLIDAFQAAGRGAGWTLPTRYYALPLTPMLRIDYIWHTPHLHATAAWVGRNSGSDHLPVLARLAWAAAPPAAQPMRSEDAPPVR